MTIDMSEYTSSQYLRVADLKEVEGGTIKATIVNIEVNEKYDKPDLILDDGSILSCSPTNCNILTRHYGARSDDWLKKEIELFVDTFDINGVQKEGIKVRPISPPLPPEKKQPIKSRKRDPFDDSIPF